MFFPISDDDRHLSGPVYVTHVLFWTNVLVFIYQWIHPDFTYGYSAVPAEITGGKDLVGPAVIGVGREQVSVPQMPGPTPIYLTLITSMFMHGGLAHLGGNLLYLWIFGDNVENRFGHLRFLCFYVISGLAASFAQIAVNPGSVIPTLGASGAISGVLGAYMVLFPRNKVNALIFFTVISIPSLLVIGMWAVTQFVNGAGSISHAGQSGGVAYMAHIGGFVAGVVMGLISRKQMKVEPDSSIYRGYARDRTVKRWW